MPAWKRWMDLGFIIVMLPGILLVGAVVALIVRFGSHGPILFCQERVGQCGRRFRLYKFRTMRVNAETASHQSHVRHLIHSSVPMTKLDAQSDPRLVPCGALLRATGLDELPQMINVMRGEMSLVGPRPCIPYEYEEYEPEQRKRLLAVPGLTGLWQVSGKNRLTFEEMVRLDIEYAHRQSLLLDLQILLRTFPALWAQVSDQRASHQAAVPAVSAEIKNVQSFRLQKL